MLSIIVVVLDVGQLVLAMHILFNCGIWWCRGTANGQVFEDTRERGKPIVFIYGGRPFTGGLCKGVEEAMASMKAGWWSLAVQLQLPD